jgi:hypothetical protein
MIGAIEMNREEHIANLKACLGVLTNTRGSVHISQETARGLIEILGELPFPKTLTPELSTVMRDARSRSSDRDNVGLHAAILAHLTKPPSMFMFYASSSADKAHCWKHKTKEGAASNQRAAMSIYPTVYKHVGEVMEVPHDGTSLL